MLYMFFPVHQPLAGFTITLTRQDSSGRVFTLT